MAAAKTVEQGALGGERISGERERALRLLEELTPRLVKSRQVRGKNIFRQAMRMLATDMSSPTSAGLGVPDLEKPLHPAGHPADGPRL